ncbi:inositol-3-phosphate synthase [Geodermatophilus sp. YIM 151500]|uniref:inositol-3-phosphate synthase n=1 Tax=Geodermatophilus sp. YIM 151500 TaxID=2984531 RepID=UPI0021E3B895|nr:inositol-3-phosphate synthase [Geodermatophilus sp. YIM 151500]MCV2489626.1 inositol-3-phosphate synthase [Geodermatophilus sp. YIM 151500]
MTGPGRRVGVAVVGLGGAVATTAVAGLELLRQGSVSAAGLPLADLQIAGRPVEEATGLVPYESLVVGGWDLDGSDLRKAAEVHGVLDPRQLADAADGLSALTPWPAAGDADFCRNVTGGNVVLAESRRAQVEAVRADLRRFREEQRLDGLVLVNLASTERWPDPAAPVLQSAAAFEQGLDADDRAITPAMVYAYAAITEGVGYVNFTPSLAADVPALVELATQRGVPVAGKDGKTGQTMVKTVLAPAFRSRALQVEGWYSTNILGNRDGLALEDPNSLESKLSTKGSVLDSILGYPVEDHLVRIDYYRPRGDSKEAWDAIDLVGFLGQRMQMKIDFQCRDSILAAPLAVELARLVDLSQQRGQGGVQEHLGWFFKAPMTADGGVPEHALHRQEAALLGWLASGTPDGGSGAAR